MKKLLLFSTLFIALLLTGCGSKEAKEEKMDVMPTPTAIPTETPEPTPDITPTPYNIPSGKVKRLLCTQTVSTVDVNMIADFDDGYLTYLGLKYEMDLSTYNDLQIEAVKQQDMCSSVAATMENYTSAFRNCKQSVENKKLLITADFDLNKLDASDISSKTPIDEAKKALEKQSYSCTITNK